jgi:hypothetical protein
MPADAVVRAVPASHPVTDTTVEYRDLPDPERAIAGTAVEDEFYHACPELPEAVRSFASRFDDHDEAYLTYRASTYALWIRITDIVHADTASPPRTNPSCGLL